MTIPAEVAALGAAIMRLRERPGCIIVTEPAGADIALRLAAEFGDARVHTHTDPPRCREDGVPVVLGALDRDVTAAAGRAWVAGRVPLMRRVRRIDTLYPDTAVALIVLAGAETAPEALRGATDVLVGQRPDVIMLHSPPAATPAGYQRLVQSDGLTWAFPEGAAEQLPRLPQRDAREPEIAFDDRLVCGGLHPTEPGAPAGGRWTGAGYAIWFALPGVAKGRWQLRLKVADWGNAADGFEATLDGIRLGVAKIDPGGMTFKVSVVRSGGGMASRVRLFPPRPVRDMRRGPRMIGLRILGAALLPA